MKTLILIFTIAFSITHLCSQVQTQTHPNVRDGRAVGHALFDEDDYVPPHPDSLSELIEGVDIQLYNGGEAYVIKDKNIYLPDAIELAKGISDIYGSGYNAVPKVFDTGIKPDKASLPPLAKTADTSLCNQIIWSEPVLLFENGWWPNLAVVGDTVYGVTGQEGAPPNLRLQYFCRSTDGGLTFDIKKNIIEDSIGTVQGAGWTRIVAHKNKVFLIFYHMDTLSTGGVRPYTGFMISTNGGETFTTRRKFVEYESAPLDMASSGDTIAVLIGDARWTKGTPVPKYIYISTNFGETWKFRGYAGGRRVYEPRIALAGGWLQQVNQWGTRNTNIEAVHYRSKIKRRNWSRRMLLSTNDLQASIQPDIVAEPNGFVGVIWNDGKYGSNFGWDGTTIFRRSLDFGKTFEPEVRLTDAPEASWGIMKPKSIASKVPVISTVWCVTFENGGRANALKLSLDNGLTWTPTYYCNIRGLSPNTAIGNGKVYWAMYDVYIGSYFVYGILPSNLKTETTQNLNEQNEEYEKEIKISNYPNPFNPNTTIIYEIIKSGYVTLEVYDVLGRQVNVLIDNEYKEEGEYDVEFDGTNIPSRVYYYRLNVVNEEFISTTASGKMLLMK
ncbi:MAG: T9SS type A sorting domain-containing protein [Bacteroidota bacterium]|nr:T9SS type A sorting domain-containing protein [Bacteroidota bacterium]